MSDTIKKIKEAIATKEAILKKWKEDVIRLEEDQKRFAELQKKAKVYAEETGNSDRFLQIMKDYQWTEDQLKDAQTKISTLSTEIATLTKKLEAEMVMDSIIEVASLQTITKDYTFRMYDKDNIWDDKLSACTIEIKFWQILYKPTGKKIWYPKFVDISGDHNTSYSISPTLARVAVRGTNDKVGASVDVQIKIGGSPKTATTSLNVGAETSSGLEAKMEVPGVGEVGASESKGFSLSYGKSETVSYNGGSVTCRFNLEYDCTGSKPTISKKSIHLPSEEDLEAVEADSDQFLDGNYDFYINTEKDNL